MTEVQREDLLQVKVAGNDVLIRSSEIREVVRMPELTPVPMGPEHLLGLASVHGQIVCMIDLSILSGWESRPGGDRFVVLRHPSKHVGIQIDAINRIHRLPVESVRAAFQGEGELLAAMDVDGENCHLLDCGVLLH